MRTRRIQTITGLLFLLLLFFLKVLFEFREGLSWDAEAMKTIPFLDEWVKSPKLTKVGQKAGLIWSEPV